MQGLRKLLRALAVLLLPLLGAVIIATASSREEVALGIAVMLFALGLVATWFWSPW